MAKANLRKYGENRGRGRGQGRNSVTGGGGRVGRVNPTGMRHAGNGPDLMHRAIMGAADVAGAIGGVGASFGRSISGAVSSFNNRPTAPGGQIKRALSDESTHALDNVLGKKKKP